MLKKINNFLAGIPATLAGGIFLILSFALPRMRVSLPVDPAWFTVIISGIPLLYLAVWRIIHNPGISRISSALLITIAMIAAIAIGDLFAAGEVAFIMAIGAILEDMTTNRERFEKAHKPCANAGKKNYQRQGRNDLCKRYPQG